VKYFSWDVKKNQQLVAERGISFEEVVYYIEKGGLLDVVQHANRQIYPNQRIFIVGIEDYAYLVPFIESEHKILLKTIIPSRKATKKYLSRKSS
jgi:uncharacterized DUF497 family protein